MVRRTTRFPSPPKGSSKIESFLKKAVVFAFAACALGLAGFYAHNQIEASPNAIRTAHDQRNLTDPVMKTTMKKSNGILFSVNLHKSGMYTGIIFDGADKDKPLLRYEFLPGKDGRMPSFYDSKTKYVYGDNGYTCSSCIIDLSSTELQSFSGMGKTIHNALTPG